MRIELTVPVFASLSDSLHCHLVKAGVQILNLQSFADVSSTSQPELAIPVLYYFQPTIYNKKFY